jgi:hypothetical protein
VDPDYRVSGSVINIHQWGGTVRLEDGRLATIPLADLDANRSLYSRALVSKSPLPFDEVRTPRHTIVTLARNGAETPVVPATEVPKLTDPVFEAHMNAYLKETQEWQPPDQTSPIERHLVRKQRRAAQFS